MADAYPSPKKTRRLFHADSPFALENLICFARSQLQVTARKHLLADNEVVELRTLLGLLLDLADNGAKVLDVLENSYDQ
jgi:hypothetical protein